MLIDTHVHVFPEIHGMNAAGPTRGLGYGRAAVGDKSVQILPPLNEKTTHTPEMLLAQMDWAGVHAAVLLQGPFYGECNDYALEAVRRYPARLAAAAYLDPWTPGAQGDLKKILDSNSFRAVKLECSEATGLCGIHPGAKLDQPGLKWLWKELENNRLVLTLDLGAVGSSSYQTAAVRQIATQYPNLKIVIAHLAQPRPVSERDPSLWRLWQEQIDLGLLPNVWFDTAALPAYVSEEGYPYPTAEQYLREAVDRIGPEKIMWGSDIPGLLGHATYPQLARLAEQHLRFLTGPKRTLILEHNATVVYHLTAT